MDNLVNYLSFFALILVVILLAWSLMLTHREKVRKSTLRGRLANLRKKIEALPDDTDENKTKKETLYRELSLEYLENILGEVEGLKAAKAAKSEKPKQDKKSKTKPRKKR